jgi:hypothetical protein
LPRVVVRIEGKTPRRFSWPNRSFLVRRTKSARQKFTRKSYQNGHPSLRVPLAPTAREHPSDPGLESPRAGNFHTAGGPPLKAPLKTCAYRTSLFCVTAPPAANSSVSMFDVTGIPMLPGYIPTMPGQMVRPERQKPLILCTESKSAPESLSGPGTAC